MLRLDCSTYVGIVETFQATLCITVFAFLGIFVVQFEIFQSLPESLAVAEYQALKLFLSLILFQVAVSHKLDIRSCIGFFLHWRCRLLDGFFVFFSGFRLF
jgi:hypothetical protein